MSLFSKLGGSEEESARIADKLAELNSASAAEAAEHEARLFSDEPQEHTFDAQQVQELARGSLDFLAGLALPLIYKYAYPPVFQSVWIWLLEYIHKVRDFSQLALGLPRGFGKTGLMKLFVLYVILFTDRKFILVMCENQTKANNVIADIIDMLQEENIRKVFGDWKIGIEIDRQDLKKFGYRGRNIILAAATVGVVRGMNLKNERPDVMIFDDIQSREMAESQTVSENLEREMFGTAMKAKSPHRCLFIFIGNMYPTKWSILRKLKHNPEWVKFIAGGILADGTSLWEDLQPIKQLIREYQNDLNSGHPEIFHSEVLNDENASANNHVDFSRLPDWRFSDGDIPGGNFIVIDPSGRKKTSDDTAIGYWEVHDGIPCLMKLKSAKMSPGETIRTALQFALENQCRLVAIESVAYQASLCYWFQFICQQMGIQGIEAVEIYPGGMNKNARILGAFKGYQAGEFYIHPTIRPEVHLQITQFNPLKTDNQDDILDLLTYPHKVIEMYGEYVINWGTIEMQSHDTAQVEDFNSPF